jgi:hypothetical protein
MHVHVVFNSERSIHIRIDLAPANNKVEYPGTNVGKYSLGGTRTLMTGCLRHHNQDVRFWRPLIALLSIDDVKVFRNDLMYRGQSASKQPRLCHRTALCNSEHIDLTLCFSCAGTSKTYNSKSSHLYTIIHFLEVVFIFIFFA